MYDKSNRCRGVLAIGFCVFLCAAGAARLHAQTGDGAATIAGAVLDVAGKPIANAAVSVKNESIGSVRQATSDNDGRFSGSCPESVKEVKGLRTQRVGGCGVGMKPRYV